jgi:hypothetical protein
MEMDARTGDFDTNVSQPIEIALIRRGADGSYLYPQAECCAF